MRAERTGAALGRRHGNLFAPSFSFPAQLGHSVHSGCRADRVCSRVLLWVYSLSSLSLQEPSVRVEGPGAGDGLHWRWSHCGAQRDKSCERMAWRWDGASLPLVMPSLTRKAHFWLLLLAQSKESFLMLGGVLEGTEICWQHISICMMRCKQDGFWHEKPSVETSNH